MSAEITVPASYLAVLKLFAADRDIRMCLNGILVEPCGSYTLLVATDGHRLGVFRVSSRLSAPPVILPIEMLRHVKHHGDAVLCVANDRKLEVRYEGAVFNGLAIEATYPDWRRVLPETAASGKGAQYNTDYLNDLGKACRMLHGNGGRKFPTLAHNGNGGAIIGLQHEDFIGILMPMHLYPTATVPTWAKKKTGKPVDSENRTKRAVTT